VSQSGLEPLVDERVGGEKGQRVHRWSAAMARPEHLPVEQQPPQQQAATVYHCGRCCSCSSSQRTEQTTTRVTPHGAETGACSPTMGCVELWAAATTVTAMVDLLATTAMVVGCADLPSNDDHWAAWGV
jgi:hypothetical protein